MTLVFRTLGGRQGRGRYVSRYFRSTTTCYTRRMEEEHGGALPSARGYGQSRPTTKELRTCVFATIAFATTQKKLVMDWIVLRIVRGNCFIRNSGTSHDGSVHRVSKLSWIFHHLLCFLSSGSLVILRVETYKS